jgi:hypothetical protein
MLVPFWEETWGARLEKGVFRISPFLFDTTLDLAGPDTETVLGSLCHLSLRAYDVAHISFVPVIAAAETAAGERKQIDNFLPVRNALALPACIVLVLVL